MSIPNKHWWLPIVVVVALAATSCDENKKRASATPPASATAPALGPPTAPAPASQTEQPAPKTDPVDDMLARAEHEYQAGQANYAAGHPEAAKENFDRAINLLLQGPVELRADDRLQRQFDKIIESVTALETQALKEGDGFTEQRPEPAPIDEANEATFPVDPAIRARAEQEIQRTRSDLPLMMNDIVAGYITYFSGRGRGTLERGLSRAGRYREMILRVLREEGIPQDLIHLAQAESGFHPLALSRAGARGMWQFMASRAKQYDLERNWWLDERQDPEKATRAAARHLKDLYQQFGDWYLAMAAYNSGPGTVQRGVERTGYADFWELYKRGVLPRETQNYVPIIVAVTIMAKNPERYGLENITPEPPPEADVVTVDHPVDLRLVAECVDTSVLTLQELNPALLRMTTPKEGRFELRLPAGTRDKFQQAIAAIPVDKRVWWRYHRVAAGDTLGGIAKRYRTTPRAIAEVNSLDPEDELALDAKLIIPVTAGRQVGDPTRYAKRPTRYRVRKGDTVLSVADDFGVPVEKLRKWNRLKGNSLRRGRVLLIYRPAGEDEPVDHARKQPATPKSLKRDKLTGKATHTVQPGDTLYSIARAYRTTVAALQRDNRLESSRLRPGDTLVINPGE